MPEPERAFLDWTGPTAPAAARWLRAHHPGRRLAATLAIVPTRQAGRRLREALAAGEIPRIVTPSGFLQPADADLADPVEAALALAAELTGPRAARPSAIFPAGVPARSFSERLALARSLRALQSELAEHGLTPDEAAGILADASGDAPRWHDFARLLASADAALTRSGLRDREAARLAFARRPRLPDGIEEVVVIAVADLQPVVALALARLDQPVTILVAGPAEPEAFDPHGRPRVAAWTDRDPGWNDFASQVRLVARPDALSLDLAAVDEIGLLDRELLPALAGELAVTERTLHDPTGQPLTAHWLVRTIGAFAALAENPAFGAAADLLRNGAVRAWLAARPVDVDAALALADRIQAAHFPATLRAARPWMSGPLLEAAGVLEAICADLRARPLEAAARLGRECGAAFAPVLGIDERELLAEATRTLNAALDRLRESVPRHPGLAAADWFHALRETLSGSPLYAPRPDDAIEASGWLELPWSESPHLLLAGMNLGKVPAPPGPELLLTEATRAALGLPGAPERRARDAYFLARLLAMRPPGAGRLEALVVQLDAEGSPLQPSPLLFAGAGSDLPARVERLFADPRPPRPDPAWTAGWLMDPPVVELPRKVSATDFERYLDCPFTFYLGRVVKMRTHAPAEDELDAAQFGDLIHFALENWAADESARHASEPLVIKRALDAQVNAWSDANLGRRLSLPLRVQLDSARARLAAFADWQAGDHRDGWRIREVETNFQEILGRPWEVDGWIVSGRVDRLDENERDGRWRVVDYKTFDAADSPAKKHLRAFRTADRPWPPVYARVPESADWWINLQLPLYRQLLVESGREPAAITCGYLNLPRTISETGLQTWDALDGALQSSALACARGVLGDLAHRRFWPPNPRAAHADFAEFFPPDAARVVNPDGAFVRSCAP